MTTQNIDENVAIVLNGILNASGGYEMFALINSKGEIALRNNTSPSPYTGIRLKSLEELNDDTLGRLNDVAQLTAHCLEYAERVVALLKNGLKKETVIENTKEAITLALESQNMIVKTNFVAGDLLFPLNEEMAQGKNK